MKVGRGAPRNFGQVLPGGVRAGHCLDGGVTEEGAGERVGPVGVEERLGVGALRVTGLSDLDV